MLDLRPLSLGEIIDRSASFWRANWKALFQLYLGFQLGEFALLKAWELFSRKYFPLSRGGAATIEAIQTQPEEAMKQLGIGMGGFMMVMLIYVLVGFFTGIAGSFFVWPRLLGRAATLSECLNRAVARLGTTVAFFGLMIGWTVVVSTLFMLPGLLAIVGGALAGNGVAAAGLVILGSLLGLAGMVLAVLWFVLRFLLASQVLALEDVGAMGVFRRCDLLASGRVEPGFLGLVKVRLTVLVTILTLVIFAVSILFGLPALIIQGMYGNLLDPSNATPDAIPQLVMVPAQLLQVVAQSIVAPLFVVFGVIFYADMRVRREGLDLELKLQAGAA